MAYYKLTILEFRAIAVFLNATEITGLALKIGTFEDADYTFALRELQKNGFMTPAERKDTWHIKETLILSMSAVVTPNHIVMVRDVLQKRSVLFFILDDQITEITITNKHVLVVEHSKLKQIAGQANKFLENSQLGQIAVADVKNNKLVNGKHIEIKGNSIFLSSSTRTVRSLQVIEEFIANSIH